MQRGEAVPASDRFGPARDSPALRDVGQRIANVPPADFGKSIHAQFSIFEGEVMESHVMGSADAFEFESIAAVEDDMLKPEAAHRERNPANGKLVPPTRLQIDDPRDVHSPRET